MLQTRNAYDIVFVSSVAEESLRCNMTSCNVQKLNLLFRQISRD